MNNQNIVMIPNLSSQYLVASPALFGIGMTWQSALIWHGGRHWVWRDSSVGLSWWARQQDIA